jgi:hypothetical protein
VAGVQHGRRRATAGLDGPGPRRAAQESPATRSRPDGRRHRPRSPGGLAGCGIVLRTRPMAVPAPRRHRAKPAAAAASSATVGESRAYVAIGAAGDARGCVAPPCRIWTGCQAGDCAIALQGAPVHAAGPDLINASQWELEQDWNHRRFWTSCKPRNGRRTRRPFDAPARRSRLLYHGGAS